MASRKNISNVRILLSSCQHGETLNNKESIEYKPVRSC